MHFFQAVFTLNLVLLCCDSLIMESGSVLVKGHRWYAIANASFHREENEYCMEIFSFNYVFL